MADNKKSWLQVVHELVQSASKLISEFLDWLLAISERILVISAILVVMLWARKIFVTCDKDSIEKATNFLRVCHNYWIGLLVFSPLLFYRILALKIMELEQAWNLKFRGKTATPAYSKEGVDLKEEP